MTMKKQWQQKRQTCRGSLQLWLQLKALARSRTNTLSTRRRHLQESSSVSLPRPRSMQSSTLQALLWNQTAPHGWYMCASERHSN